MIKWCLRLWCHMWRVRSPGWVIWRWQGSDNCHLVNSDTLALFAHSENSSSWHHSMGPETDSAVFVHCHANLWTSTIPVLIYITKMPSFLWAWHVIALLNSLAVYCTEMNINLLPLGTIIMLVPNSQENTLMTFCHLNIYKLIIIPKKLQP